MDTGSTIARAPRQVSCPLRDEAAVLNMTTGQYYGLNSVAARIWDLIESPKTLTEVAGALLSEYDVPPATCNDDLARLVTELRGAGLVEIQHGPLGPMAAPPAC